MTDLGSEIIAVLRATERTLSKRRSLPWTTEAKILARRKKAVMVAEVTFRSIPTDNGTAEERRGPPVAKVKQLMQSEMP
jgi:hypothetical protein